LRGWKYDSRIVDALLEIGSKSPYKEEKPNGLVVTQRLFMEVANRQQLPASVVREGNAQNTGEA